MYQRLDVFMFEKQLVDSRQKAQTLIKSNNVTVNGSVQNKPSFKVSENDSIQIIAQVCEFVGRGGLKLKKALDVFKIDVKDEVCIDIGASTGGFTDCLLQNGAQYVYAVDVGHGQLSEKLVLDKRVKNFEGTNIRDFSADCFTKTPNLAVCDVSFVSLKLILPHIKRLVPDNATAVVLIKPQFEAGKENVKKGGIVKDKKVHVRVIDDFLNYCSESGFSVLGLDFSPITGGSGNIEYLLYLSCDKTLKSKCFDTKVIVETAFLQHKV